MADEEEEEEEEGRREGEGGRERRRSTLLHPSSSPTKFDYSPYHGSTTFTFPEFTEGEVGTALVYCLVLFVVVCCVLLLLLFLYLWEEFLDSATLFCTWKICV